MWRALWLLNAENYTWEDMYFDSSKQAIFKNLHISGEYISIGFYPPIVT